MMNGFHYSIGMIAWIWLLLSFALASSATPLHRVIALKIIPRGGDNAIAAPPGNSSDIMAGPSLSKFSLFRPRRRNADSSGAKNKRTHQRVKKRTAAFTNKMKDQLEDARRLFLDRMAVVSFKLIDKEKDATMFNDALFIDGNDDDITPQSDLTLPNRSIYIVTTAALPWRTGTSVNPLLRAAYLWRRVQQFNNQTNEHESEVTGNSTDVGKSMQQRVTLVIPWLELEEDRLDLYGKNMTFSSPEEQEDYIREWLRNDAHMMDAANPETGIRIIFYSARYHSELNSIFAMGDLCDGIRNQTDGDNLTDAVCILEEPEHLNWYRAPGEGWTKVFGFVVGIIHTNYVEYASNEFHGLWTSPAIQVMSSAMVRAYCHKVIKLSEVLQSYAPEKESVKNVHGVREDFLREGKRRGLCTHITTERLSEELDGQVYYIGKILWAKGFEQLIELEEFYRECTGKYFTVDIYGGGPEEESIKRAFHGRKNCKQSRARNKRAEEELKKLSREAIARKLRSMRMSSQEFEMPKTLYEWRRLPIPASFMGSVDHASLGEKYRIFVNPSVSEVLCTTTFEALAMGKFVIIPYHKSNNFFMQFPNCLVYRNKMDFVANLRWALTHEPEPLTPDLANEFTWEAATDRLIQSSAITIREARERAILGKAKLDERIAFFHHELGKGAKGDALRKFLGGGPVSQQCKYELSKRGLDEAETEGLTEKFKKSSFVQAIKKSFKGSQDGLPYFATS